MSDLPRGQARRYARALLEVAEGQGAQEALRLRGELREMASLVEDHPALGRALGGVGVTLEARGRALAAIAREGGASRLLQRLVQLLAERDHLSVLSRVAELYGEQVNADHGIVAVQATGAVPLDEPQERALVEALRGVAGREVELTARVEPEVLGGLRVKMGGRTYDGTVRTQLQLLRRRLASGS